MIGIGTDLVDIDRFRVVLGRTPSIARRLFTDGEREYAGLHSDPAERFAVRFAAKEAALKALGLGLGGMAFRDIEVVRAQGGQPSLLLHGQAAEVARERGVDRWLLTLSHSALVASATAVALGSTPPELAYLRHRIDDTGTPEGVLEGDLGEAEDEAEGVHLVSAGDVAAWLPRRPREAHKWQTALCLVAGSPGMSGAAALAAGGAQRAGAGYVRLCTPGGLASGAPVEVVQVPLPAESWSERVLEDLQRFSALVIGNGLGVEGETQAEVRRVVSGAAGVPTLVDADGITALGSEAAQVIGARAAEGREPTVVLTPHDGEFARLAGGPPGPDRTASARDLAARLGAVVLLKGSLTIVAHPDGRVLLSNTGDSRLATAGTGDVLAGVIGALCAQGMDVWRAAGAGAFIHGLAGALGWRIGLVASDLLSTLPPVLQELTYARGGA